MSGQARSEALPRLPLIDVILPMYLDPRVFDAHEVTVLYSLTIIGAKDA
jgi:hypothetical protein